MASGSSGESVQYTESLSISDKRRYLEKTKEIGDPYGYPVSALSQDDLPPVIILLYYYQFCQKTRVARKASLYEVLPG